MFNIFILFGVFLVPFISEAKIIETAKIAEVIPLIDAETWFLVDLDNTFFEAKQALGHANWFYDEVQQRMQYGMTREEAIQDAYPLFIKTQKVCPVKPLEQDFVSALIAFQNEGVVVMGLTHRQPSVADSTLRQVASLKFDFLITAPSKETFSVPAKNPTLYTGGVFFVGDCNKKGELFLPFLSIIDQKPKKIVFIDDKRKNVEEMEILSSMGIEYIGVHYTAIEEAKPIYSHELAEFQYKFLDQIMSNEAAQVLIDHHIEQ